MRQYCAVYDGPGGPISVEFEADDDAEALDLVARNDGLWFEAARDDLNVEGERRNHELDPDPCVVVHDLRIGACYCVVIQRAERDDQYGVWRKAVPEDNVDLRRKEVQS